MSLGDCTEKIPFNIHRFFFMENKNGKKKKKWVYNSEWMYPIFGSSKSETAYLCRDSNTCDDP